MQVANLDPARLLRYARGTAWSYVRIHPKFGRDLDDLIGDALVGALSGLRTFDPSRGGTLENYLWVRMNGEMVDGIRRRGTLSRKFIEKLRADPSLPIPAAMKEYASVEVLREKIGYDCVDLTTERQYEKVEAGLTAPKLLKFLRGRELEIVVRTVLGEETLRSVADRWQVTESRASQIRSNALDRLRRSIVVV